MKDKLLYTALRLARKGKYGDVISLMESEILRYRDSFRFYYILALSCLRTGDFGRAYTYFKSAHDIKNRDVNVLLGIAALNIKRAESARAVDMYLKIIDIEPKNKTALAALSVLRRYGGSEELHEWVESGKIKKLYPPFPKLPFNAKRFFIGLLITLTFSGLVFFSITKLNILSNGIINGNHPLRPGFNDSVLSSKEKANTVETGGVYELILTEAEVLKTYEAARSNFNLYNDNLARYYINKLLFSNCSSGIKNKAKVLIKYIDESRPDFATLKENFSYQDVKNEAYLYSGCYVIWSGRTSNIEQEENSTSFSLLVGYENFKVLLGTVSVHCDFAFDIDTERPIRVLGQVLANQNEFSLKGISIHQQ